MPERIYIYQNVETFVMSPHLFIYPAVKSLKKEKRFILFQDIVYVVTIFKGEWQNNVVVSHFPTIFNQNFTWMLKFLIRFNTNITNTAEKSRMEKAAKHLKHFGNKSPQHIVYL